MIKDWKETIKARAKKDPEFLEGLLDGLWEELREARLQSLSDLGQAQEAYEQLVDAREEIAYLVDVLINIAAVKHPDEPFNPYKDMARRGLRGRNK